MLDQQKSGFQSIMFHIRRGGSRERKTSGRQNNISLDSNNSMFNPLTSCFLIKEEGEEYVVLRPFACSN